MLKTCWAALMLVGFSSICFASEGEADSLSLPEQLDKLFFEWDRLDRPGGSVAVVLDGEPIFQEAYGLSSLELSTANSVNTVYDVTALAEPFTAMAILMLEDAGRLSLKDPVTQHISDLPAFTSTITLQHLLDHTSGLWDWQTTYRASGGYLEDVITWDHVHRLIQCQSAPSFAPGTQHEHSVTNYALLAEIVHQVTGQSFRDWLWENVLRPLGMTRTTVRDRRGEPIENGALAYEYHPRRGYRIGTANLSVPGSHGLHSTVADMMHWVRQLQAPDDGFAAIVERLLTQGKLENGETIRYGHGLHTDEYQGHPRYRAAGQWQGFNSVLHYYPEQRLAIVILCNWISGWVNPTYLAHEVAGVLLVQPEPEATGTGAATATANETDPEDFDADPAAWQQYVGDYRWEPGNVFGIVLEGDQLLYQYAPGGTMPLTALSNTRFVIAGYDYFFTFLPNHDGRSGECLIEHEGDPDVRAPRIELVTPSPKQLQEYAGDYRCEQLGILYSVLVRDESLVLTQRRRPEIMLSPEARDHFTVGSDAFGMVEFLRNDRAEITGLRVNTLNTTFERAR